MSTILHLDMDAFFAAVEQQDNPEYKNKPLIIGGRKDALRGVVSTCSYEARKFGIHSAMPIKRAVALCPHGIFIPGRMERYQEVSRQILNILPQFTPIIEPLSIDEAFLDMTGCEHFYNSLTDMGTAVKEQIQLETGLTASVGIAPNKFLAKIASDWEKPNGLTVITSDQIDEFLLKLPLSKIWGVGNKTQQVLIENGIKNVQDIRNHPLESLKKKLGNSLGTHLYQLSRGIDHRKVEPNNAVKSISQEVTFAENSRDLDFLKSQLASMTEKVGYRLRQQKLYARTVNIKVRFGDFKTITRSHTLDYTISDNDSIFKIGWDLFTKIPFEPIRLLGIGVSNFSLDQQLSLFDNTTETNELAEVLDKINTRYNTVAVTKGRTLIGKEKQSK